MGRVYTGRKGRAIGTAGGLLMLTTGVGMYVFMGATASNVPLPAVLVAAIHGLAPGLEQAAGQRMPLVMVALFGATSLVLTAVGLRNVVEALVKDDYSIRVT